MAGRVMRSAGLGVSIARSRSRHSCAFAMQSRNGLESDETSFTTVDDTRMVEIGRSRSRQSCACAFLRICIKTQLRWLKVSEVIERQDYVCSCVPPGWRPLCPQQVQARLRMLTLILVRTKAAREQPAYIYRGQSAASPAAVPGTQGLGFRVCIADYGSRRHEMDESLRAGTAADGEQCVRKQRSRTCEEKGDKGEENHANTFSRFTASCSSSESHRRGDGLRVLRRQDAGEYLLQPHDAVGALVAPPPERKRACGVCASRPSDTRHRHSFIN